MHHDSLDISWWVEQSVPRRHTRHIPLLYDDRFTSIVRWALYTSRVVRTKSCRDISPSPRPPPVSVGLALAVPLFLAPAFSLASSGNIIAIIERVPGIVAQAG